MAQRAHRASPVGVIDPAPAPRSGDAVRDPLDQLRGRYAIRQPEAVASFLHAHPSTIPLLLEIADVVPHYFGGVPLALDVFADPEDDEPLPELFALVQTTLPPEQAVAALDRLGEEWWFERSPSPPATVVIGVEFA